MRAVTFNAAKDLTIGAVPDPTTGAGQVKVEVSYNGICGTDLHE